MEYRADMPGNATVDRRFTRHIGPVAPYLHESLQARGQIWSTGPICLVMRQWTCLLNFISHVFIFILHFYDF